MRSLGSEHQARDLDTTAGIRVSQEGSELGSTDPDATTAIDADAALQRSEYLHSGCTCSTPCHVGAPFLIWQALMYSALPTAVAVHPVAGPEEGGTLISLRGPNLCAGLPY